MDITSHQLKRLYLKEKKSVSEIAKIVNLSETGVNYWLRKFEIPKRTVSEAIYIKHNPKGDPFRVILPKNKEDAKLFGMGVGLYWGEGTKADKGSVRLGNSDPAIMRVFIEFLIKFFNVDKKDLKFHLHTFTDIDLEETKNYWKKELKVQDIQFYKPTVTITGKLGNYRKKSKYGVLTVYYSNIKLRNILVSLLPM
jgi:hypothetical protein